MMMKLIKGRERTLVGCRERLGVDPYDTVDRVRWICLVAKSWWNSRSFPPDGLGDPFERSAPFAFHSLLHHHSSLLASFSVQHQGTLKQIPLVWKVYHPTRLVASGLLSKVRLLNFRHIRRTAARWERSRRTPAYFHDYWECLPDYTRARKDLHR